MYSRSTRTDLEYSLYSSSTESSGFIVCHTSRGFGAGLRIFDHNVAIWIVWRYNVLIEAISLPEVSLRGIFDHPSHSEATLTSSTESAYSVVMTENKHSSAIVSVFDPSPAGILNKILLYHVVEALCAQLAECRVHRQKSRIVRCGNVDSVGH